MVKIVLLGCREKWECFHTELCRCSETLDNPISPLSSLGSERERVNSDHLIKRYHHFVKCVKNLNISFFLFVTWLQPSKLPAAYRVTVGQRLDLFNVDITV